LNELLKRVLVALIGIPLFVILIYVDGYPFFGLILLISTLSLWEFYRMSENKQIFPHKTSGMLFNVAVIAAIAYKGPAVGGALIAGGLVVFSVYIFIVEMFSGKRNSLNNISVTIAGIVYVSLSFACMAAVRELHLFLEPLGSTVFDSLLTTAHSGQFLLSIFIAVWICDSGAYFTGVSIGKHKMFPRVSPNKTWEGAVGGFVFSVAGFWLSLHFFGIDIPLVHIIVLGAIIGTIGQIGDLAESLIKRDAGVKDSSAIIPGHGGFLDRFDSMLFAVPTVCLYVIAVLFFEGNL